MSSLRSSAEPSAPKAADMANSPPADLASLPAAYRAWRASDLGRTTDRIEEELILTLTGPVAGKRVLDVGCGDGVLSVALALQGAHVTGVYVDRHMLDAARNRANSAHAAVTYIEGNTRSLPFADGTFDVVVAVTVLCFVPNAESAASEMARVLRPGGRLVIGELGRYSLWAAKRRLSGWLGSRMWRLASFRSARELERIAASAKLHVTVIRGAIYYPPCNLCARWLAPIDRYLATVTTTGAAFIALAADKLTIHS
jgi:2-polyprenyl-3-methyl-5-hydroxy-6-metoxy-1,4-benzoquinol methylase